MKFYPILVLYGPVLSIVEEVAREQGITLLAFDEIAIEHIPETERGFRAGDHTFHFTMEAEGFDIMRETMRELRRMASERACQALDGIVDEDGTFWSREVLEELEKGPF